MNERKLHDADARHAAATDFETNLVVEAGAGTGKTSLLVERILNAVGSGRAEITRLAAITFTEKAAGEMRTRIADGLEGLRAIARGEEGADPPGEASRSFEYLTAEAGLSEADVGARALRALEEMDRATVVTVHAFCSELLRGHPIEADVDPDFAVDTGQHTARLREELWERFAASELGPAARRPGLWTEVLDRFALADVEAIASGLAGFGMPAAALTPPFSAAATVEMLEALAARVLPDIEALLERAGGLTPKTVEYFETMRRAFGLLGEGGIDAFRRCIEGHTDVARRVEKRNRPTPNKKLSGISPEEFRRLSRRLSKLAGKLMGADDAPFAPLLELVTPFADRLRGRLLEQGLVGFDALLTLARDLLRAHPDVRRTLRHRFDMLLVDEFQDIDPLQYEIVLLLAQQVEEGRTDPLDSPLEPGRLFVVGDPKQSIYRFRGADYDAYRSAVDRIVRQGGRRLDLVSNFRSLPGIIEPVNRLLENTPTWQASPYQPPYTAIRSVRDGVDSPCVELWTVSAPGKAEARRRAEARSIAAEIERLVSAGTLAYEHVTILFRAFTNIGVYLRALRERGIPFVVDGGREFLKRPEVAQLMATLRTLAQPLDEAALLAFLRSPTGGVADTELARFAATGARWNWRTPVDAEGFPQIADRFELLNRLSREMLHLPADAAIRRVVDRTQMLPLGAAAFEGAQRAANLRKLSEAAGELARDGRLSLDQVVEALREGRLADIETDSPLADDRADAVRITSIHRMKGLENRWVFLPDLSRGEHRGPQLRQTAAVAWTPDRRPIPALRIDRLASTSWVWLDDQNALHGDAEETRVLYVALTRACDRLVLVAGRTDRPAPWIAALHPWGYSGDAPPDDGALLSGGRVVHRIVEPPADRRPSRERESADAQAARERYERAMEALRSSAAPAFRSPSLLEAETAERPVPGANRVRAKRSRDLARAVGIVVHRFLEDGLGPPAERVARVEQLSARVARDEGLEVRELIAESRAVVESFAESSLAAELRELDCIGREMPLLLRDDDGGIYRGSIDLLYRDAGGGLVVADYKTDPETDRATLRERYAAQLGVYAEAVRQACDLEVRPRTELWLVRRSRRVVLD